MKYADFVTADLRLTLLRCLHEAAGYRLNHFTLQKFAASLGHDVSSDRLKAQLAWLQEQGLTTLAQEGEVTLATLTERGADVAFARADCPGVARPKPGA